MLQKFKDVAIRAGLEPWLRPVSDRLIGRRLDRDDLAAFALIAGLQRHAVCVDVGCHKGKFLDAMRSAAPQGRFFAFEPRRGGLALAGSHLVGALGANAVTRHDAVLSVHAGFRGRELTAAWPRSGAAWSLHEEDAGLFSHCFSAQRTGST